MRWFYILTAGLVIGLGLAPWYFIKPVDTSMLKGKSVIWDSYAAKINSLDPATCGDTSSAGLQGNFYETFFAYDFLKREHNGDWQRCMIPQLAQALPEISADGKTWTIHLKKGVKYHRNPCFGVETDAGGAPLMDDDGKTPKYETREVVADDFVLAFKRIADYHVVTDLSLAFVEDKIVGIKEYRARTQGYAVGDFSRYKNENIEGIKSLDPYTIQIKLTMPYPRLLYVLAINNYAPIPHEVIDYWLSTQEQNGRRVPLDMAKRDPVIHDFRAAVGTGAYYLHTFVDGGNIVLLRNPDFRADYYPSEGEPGDREAGLLDDAGRRLPFVDAIFEEYVPEDNPNWLRFMTKQTDVVGIPRDVYTQVITPSRGLTQEFLRRGIQLYKYEQPAVYWLTFNMADKALGNSKSLRQALNMAFNTEDYIEVLANGRGYRAVNVIPRSFQGHDETGPGPYAKHDPEAARQKLQQARQELVDAGVIQPGEGIPPLTLDMGGTDEQTRRLGEFVQQQFQAVGVTLKIDMQDWPTLLAKMNRKQCQIYMSGWHADYPDAESFLQLFYTPNIDRGTNNSNYSNKEYDALYELADRLPAGPERTAIYVKMARIINEDCPVLLMTEPITFALCQPWVHDYKPHPLGYGFAKYRRIDEISRQKAGGR